MGKHLRAAYAFAYAKWTSGLRGSMFKIRALSTLLTRALRMLTPATVLECGGKRSHMSRQHRLRLPCADRNVACGRHMKAKASFNFAYAGLTPTSAQRSKINNWYVKPHTI